MLPAANDVLRNDVGLRPMMLRFAQTEFPPQVLKNIGKCDIIIGKVVEI